MSITFDWPLPPEGIRFLVPHSQISQLAENALTKPLYPIAFGYYPCAKNHGIQRQVHDNYLLIYCTDGGGELQVAQRHYQVKPGDLVLLPKGVSHQVAAKRRNPWSIYWAHFEGNLCPYFSTLLKMDQPVQSIGLQPKVIADFEALLELRNSNYSNSALIHACHYLQQLLSYMALLVRAHRPPMGADIELKKVQGVMQENLHHHLDLDTLAAQAGLSKYYFSKCFKAQTGQSPIQYFIGLKMQRACYLLDSSPVSIKKAAVDLGYDDAYYFSRLFKKVIGLSPAQYRHSKVR